MLRQKELKYIEKWGNKSRVGAIINNYNIESLNTALEGRVQPQSMTTLSPMSGRISQKKSERLSSLPSIKKRNLDSVRRNNQSLAVKSQNKRLLGGSTDRRNEASRFNSIDMTGDNEHDLAHFVTTNQTFNQTL